MKISQKGRSAIYLGTLCSISYFAVYIARNILGAVTPNMTESGFSLDHIGNVAAAFLLSYAIGQLINGWLGDRIKAKYMICFGLLSAGIANIVFVLLSGMPKISLIAYAWTGFSLSMIYGPMTKLVAESVELVYATRCSLGYTFASFFGSPAAGLLATFFTWQTTFHISSAALISMSVVCFTLFSLFEKKGIVKYRDKNGVKQKKDYKVLFKRNIIMFSFISMITGVIRTSWLSFLTMYFVERLNYSQVESTSIFSVATLIISFTTFIAIFIYERLNKNMHLSQLIFFVASALFFVLTYFVTNPILNIVFMILAIMASNSVATMLWSVYCPSMCDTGLVSSVTGFLDFLSYIAAALASLVTPKLVKLIGWDNFLFVIMALILCGVFACALHYITRKKKTETN